MAEIAFLFGWVLIGIIVLRVMVYCSENMREFADDVPALAGLTVFVWPVWLLILILYGIGKAVTSDVVKFHKAIKNVRGEQ